MMMTTAMDRRITAVNYILYCCDRSVNAVVGAFLNRYARRPRGLVMSDLPVDDALEPPLDDHSSSSVSSSVDSDVIVASVVTFPIVTAIEATTSSDSGRRQRHRQYDLQRRRREAAAIRRLADLVTADRTRKRSKNDRTSILEAAIDIVKRTREREKVERNRAYSIVNATAECVSSTNATQQATLLAAQSVLDTAQHDVNQRVITHEQLFTSLFANSSTTQILINADSGVCLSVNNAFVSIMSVSADQLIGQQVDHRRMDWINENVAAVEQDTNNLPVYVRQRRCMQPAKDADLERKRLQTDLYRGLVDMIEYEECLQNAPGCWLRIRKRAWLSKAPTPPESSSVSALFPPLTHVTLIHMIGQVIYPSTEEVRQLYQSICAPA